MLKPRESVGQGAYADLVLAERKSSAEAFSGLNPVAFVVSRDTAPCQDDRPMKSSVKVRDGLVEGFRGRRRGSSPLREQFSS